MKEEILRIENVTRKEDGVVILDNINLHIFKGEIMGIIFITAHGEKDLVELICKNAPIDYGRVYYRNELVNYYEYSNMSLNPIHVIGRDNRLITNLTVMENIFVIRRGLKKHLISRRQLRSQFYLLFGEMNSFIEPDSLISELSRLDRCLVELFQAIVADCRLIILQDITSFLSAVDLEKFYEYIRYYSKKGVSFLYICSHHEKLFPVCSRVVLMRNARVIKILDHEELTEQKIKPYTISFEVAEPMERTEIEQGILTFDRVCTDTLKDVNFSVQKGECVVILDKSNDICTDFLDLMNGQKVPIKGSIYYNNELYSRKKARKAIENKILTIGKNPVKTMLFQDMSYAENLNFLTDRKLGKSQIKKSIKESILEEYKKYVGEDIYAVNLDRLELKSLYNLVYYRIHLYNPSILFCVQPCNGADMYLRKHIVDLLYELKKKGITIIIFSLNIEDSLAVADRLLILKSGQITNSYEKKEFSHIVYYE